MIAININNVLDDMARQEENYSLPLYRQELKESHVNYLYDQPDLETVQYQDDVDYLRKKARKEIQIAQILHLRSFARGD